MLVPIRHEERSRYPTNWKAISHRIRFARAEGQCECRGHCGLDHGIPFTRCTAVHGKPAPVSKKRVVLTVAHLDHVPENCEEWNLLACCQACHLRHDKEHHAETRKRKVRS
jgi:hypothetical protein